MGSHGRLEDAEANNPLSSDTREARDVSTVDSGKNFQQRVEEFSMWKDEATFQEMEYERRRQKKKKMKGTILSDKGLVWSNRLYIPVIGLIVISVVVLLLSSIEGVGEGSIIWDHKHIFQILGAVFLTIGIIALMATAAYSYHREDKVRAKCGYPSLFMSSLKGEISTKNMEETILVQNTFVDRPRRYSGRLSRLNSMESSKCSHHTNNNNHNNNLGHSFSSTSTAMSWVHKHRDFNARNSRNSSIRRENSDSALDQIFARNRLITWHMDGSSHEVTSNDDDINVNNNNDDNNGDNSTDNSVQIMDENADEISCDSKDRSKNGDGGDVSKIESSVSMASSGYYSNMSTHCLSHINSSNNHNHDHNKSPNKILSRHLSEPSRKVTVHGIAKRDRMFSERIIPDQESLQEQQHSVISTVPIINIECV